MTACYYNMPPGSAEAYDRWLRETEPPQEEEDMDTTPHPKFVQIAYGAGNDGYDEALLALDQDGNVWEHIANDRTYRLNTPNEYTKKKGWHPLVMDRHEG